MKFITTMLSVVYALSIPATLLGAIWTRDLRWAASTVILVGCLVLMNMLPGDKEKEEAT